MALKPARAMGAELTLFNRSPRKERNAFSLGADKVVISTDADQMSAVAGIFDIIIDTVPYTHDLNPYMATLATQGALAIEGYLRLSGASRRRAEQCAYGVSWKNPDWITNRRPG